MAKKTALEVDRSNTLAASGLLAIAEETKLVPNTIDNAPVESNLLVVVPRVPEKHGAKLADDTFHNDARTSAKSIPDNAKKSIPTVTDPK